MSGNLESQLYLMGEIRSSEEDFLGYIPSLGTRVLRHSPKSKKSEEILNIFLTDLDRLGEKYTSRVKNLNGKKSHLKYSENIYEDFSGFYKFWNEKIKENASEIDPDCIISMKGILEEIRNHGIAASDYIPAILDSSYLQDGVKRNEFSGFFKRLDENGSLKKTAALVSAAAILATAGVGCFLFQKSQKEQNERIKPLIQAGLSRDGSINFDKTHPELSPYDNVSIDFARMWVNNKNIANSLLAKNNSVYQTVYGDFDNDGIINLKEMVGSLSPILDPLKPNLVVGYALTKENDLSLELASALQYTETTNILTQAEKQTTDLALNYRNIINWNKDKIEILSALYEDLPENLALNHPYWLLAASDLLPSFFYANLWYDNFSKRPLVVQHLKNILADIEKGTYFDPKDCYGITDPENILYLNRALLCNQLTAGFDFDRGLLIDTTDGKPPSIPPSVKLQLIEHNWTLQDNWRKALLENAFNENYLNGCINEINPDTLGYYTLVEAIKENGKIVDKASVYANVICGQNILPIVKGVCRDSTAAKTIFLNSIGLVAHPSEVAYKEGTGHSDIAIYITPQLEDTIRKSSDPMLKNPLIHNHLIGLEWPSITVMNYISAGENNTSYHWKSLYMGKYDYTTLSWELVAGV